MKNKNNIDRIFSEGLAKHSELPPAFVWDAISDRLEGAKHNKKILLLWRSLAAAAIFGLIFLGGLFWNSKNATLADTKLQAKSTTIQPIDLDKGEIGKNNTIIDEVINQVQETQANVTQKQNKVIQKNTDKSTYAKNSLGDNMQAITNKDKQTYTQIITPVIAEAKDIERSEIPLLKKMVAQTVHNLADYTTPNTMHLLKQTNEPTLTINEPDSWILAFDNNKPLKGNDKKGLQFALGGQFSPSYSYNEPGQSNGSSAVAINEEGIMSYTGGINLNIKTRKRWEIETGVYYSQIGQKFSNPMLSNPDKMVYTTSPSAGIQSKKPNLNNSMGNIILQSSAREDLIKEVAIHNAAIRLNANDFAYSPNQVEAITVQQELNYIEIPFLLRYNLLNKSVDLSLSGGMSTNFLIGNSAYRMENNSKNKIGETQDINDISYSAIFGFGFRAPILKSLDFNLEPRIKYFMNSVTDNPESSYKPYSIGIYTGVSYRF